VTAQREQASEANVEKTLAARREMEEEAEEKLRELPAVSKRGRTEGRGHKGGDREAARRSGVPVRTAEQAKAHVVPTEWRVCLG